MKKAKKRRTLDISKWLGKVDIPKWGKPEFVNDGSGNGWYVYPDGQWSYVYFR